VKQTHSVKGVQHTGIMSGHLRGRDGKKKRGGELSVDSVPSRFKAGGKNALNPCWAVLGGRKGNRRRMALPRGPWD